MEEWQDIVDLRDADGLDTYQLAPLKRQRKSAPKVKSGCRTCKARRVKCDETKPDCTRCTSTGRTCEGYESLPRPKQKRRPRRPKPVPAQTQQSGSGASNDAPSPEARSTPTASDSLTVMRPGQLVMIDATHEQSTSYDFFRNFTVMDLSALHEYRLWMNSVMPAALCEPAIYHAVVALGMKHQQLLGSRTSNIAILKQYNIAVVELSKRLSGHADYEVNKVALLTCLIFTMIESLFKSPLAARRQLEQGIMILSTWHANRTKSNLLLAPPKHGVNGMPDTVGSTEDDELCEKFARMDLITARFMGIEQKFVRTVPLPSYFNNLDEAWHHMAFQNSAINAFVTRKDYQTANPYTSPEAFHEREARRSQLKEKYSQWLSLFEHLVSIVVFPAATPRQYRTIRNMRAYHCLNTLTLACIHLSEMTYDQYHAHFEQSLNLCRELEDAYALESGIPTLSLDCGFTGCLTFTAMKCRDPFIRRKALKMLQDAPPHNSFIQSTVAAKFLAKVIELEERGTDGPQTAADIKESARFVFAYQKESPDLRSATLTGMRLLPGFKPAFEQHTVHLDNT